MIALFTDFGSAGPYSGQVELMLRQQAPGVDIIHLLSDAPLADPVSSAYLLAALVKPFPLNTVFVCVVDPGVGGRRLPLIVRTDRFWFVGPDNGLLNTIALQSQQYQCWSIEWQPKQLSSSFHGRDLFAPIAAKLTQGVDPATLGSPYPLDLSAWSADWATIVYIDHYGNAWTGLRYQADFKGQVLEIQSQRVQQAGTFCSVSKGGVFWYQNSSGLVEVAVNCGRADEQLGLTVGTQCNFLMPARSGLV